MRIAIASSGLGHVARGIETRALGETIDLRPETIDRRPQTGDCEERTEDWRSATIEVTLFAAGQPTPGSVLKTPFPSETSHPTLLMLICLTSSPVIPNRRPGRQRVCSSVSPQRLDRIVSCWQTLRRRPAELWRACAGSQRLAGVRRSTATAWRV